MEKTVLKTLIYADIFDIPLRAWEIQKWSIDRQIGLKDVENTLKRLTKKSKVQSKKGYYFLNGREKIVNNRIRRQKLSGAIFQKIKWFASLLKVIPWVKLVGVSGKLAMQNINPKDDLELIVITARDRVWISRFLMIVSLDILKLLFSVLDTFQRKIKLKLILEEYQLEFTTKNLFTAHEVLEMKVLWQREDIYSKYLEQNFWAFEFLPSWAISKNEKLKVKRKKEKQIWLVNILENFARKIQSKSIENIYAKDEKIEVIKIFNEKIRQL